MTASRCDDPEPYLRALVAGLSKCGIPVQVRCDSDQRRYVRASHATKPLSTDVYCVQEDGEWYFRSEWGNMIGPAEDTMAVIEYVVMLL